MEVRELGPGRFLVKSQSSDSFYSVTDGICDCKGYEFRQKCKHVSRLIDLGKLDPAKVEGYFRNQNYPPIKVASPDYDPGRYTFWIAAFDNTYLLAHYRDFFCVGLTPKPYQIVAPYTIEGIMHPLTPDEVLTDLDPDDFVTGYRAQLNEYGTEKIATFMANCRLQARGRSVVFLTSGHATAMPFSFANPRRVFASFWYEQTHQVVPEIKG